MTPARGDLYFANLSGIGRKLVLVVSWDEVSAKLHQPIVCLVTSRDRFRTLPTYVTVEPPEGNLNRTSFVLCHATLTIEDWRLDAQPHGSLGTTTMKEVDTALSRALGLKS